MDQDQLSFLEEAHRPVPKLRPEPNFDHTSGLRCEWCQSPDANHLQGLPLYPGQLRPFPVILLCDSCRRRRVRPSAEGPLFHVTQLMWWGDHWRECRSWAARSAASGSWRRRHAS